MSHTNRHRGPHPKDEGLFAACHLPTLCTALKDYCWLLSSGYTPNASMKLIGDRFQIALAILNFESTNGHLPPAYVADKTENRCTVGAS